MDSEGKGERELEEKEDQDKRDGGEKEILSGQYHQVRFPVHTESFD